MVGKRNLAFEAGAPQPRAWRLEFGQNPILITPSHDSDVGLLRCCA
jgi:hypothetical protein